jgi:hypothetical protein
MSSMIDELESLLFDSEAGTLDDNGIQRVREILRCDEEARTFYSRQQVLNAAMTLNAVAGLEPAHVDDGNTVDGNTVEGKADEGVRLKPTPATGVRNSTGRVFRVSIFAMTAATLLIFALAGRVLYLELAEADRPREKPRPAPGNHPGNHVPRDDRTEATSAGVALVTKLVDVVWKTDQTHFAVGDALMPGRVAIESGFAQIEFFCGATVIVEGPAELDLKSATLARVHSGRLRAQVPPAARGFSLEVDDMKVVDLGTEFGLSVSSDGADIQVFDGEVELHAAKENMRLLTAGQAVLRNAKGEFQFGQTTPKRFLDIASLETRADDQRTARYDRWKAWSDEVRHDTRLITYYSFDQQGGWARKLHSSVLPDNEEFDGAIVGAGRVPGRWPLKAGLEFKRPGDRVRVQISGEFGSLTFACWVKIDSLDRWYNSLFLTDGYNQGEPHWQILDSGQLFFSVRSKRDRLEGETQVKGQTHQEVLSPSFWTPAMSGRWLHLATTYSVERAVTTHYVNGEILHEETIGEKMLVHTTRIGAATIGNWSVPTKADAEFAIRNINGTIDEFAIFASALSANEIEEMYENGRP